MTDTQVGELLERATSQLHPSTDLVAGGIAAGRRQRRRGLAVSAAGGFAAAAVAAAVVVSLPGNGSGPDRTVVADPSSSAGTSSYAAQPSAPSGPLATPENDGPFPVAPGSMAATLATLLPGPVAGQDDETFHLDRPDGWQSGAVEYAGGTVQVSIQHSTGPQCDGDLARGSQDCTALGGGYFTSTYTGRITSVDEGFTGVRNIGVTYYTPDGYKINATAGNGSFTDPAHPSVDEPVLDLAALTAIAENPVWQGAGS